MVAGDGPQVLGMMAVKPSSEEEWRGDAQLVRLVLRRKPRTRQTHCQRDALQTNHVVKYVCAPSVPWLLATSSKDEEL